MKRKITGNFIKCLYIIQALLPMISEFKTANTEVRFDIKFFYGRVPEMDK